MMGSEEEHLHTLERVLTRLQGAGLKCKRSKCFFMVPTVEYLGHIISEKVIQPTEEKTKAIVNAPTPQNVTQLKPFLGLINYYSKCVIAPLYTTEEKYTVVLGQGAEPGIQEGKGTVNIHESINAL